MAPLTIWPRRWLLGRAFILSLEGATQRRRVGIVLAPEADHELTRSYEAFGSVNPPRAVPKDGRCHAVTLRTHVNGAGVSENRTAEGSRAQGWRD